MAFEVLPAIDVAAGRLARVTPRGVAPVEAFAGDPRRAAERFASAGARWVHVVDLDLADTGTPGNLEVIAAVAGLGVGVQASGGVASGSHVDALLEAGASRVVLGSAALVDREATRRLVGRAAGALVIGIEAVGSRIVPRGSAAHELVLSDTIRWLRELEVPRYLFTEVGRVGSLGGPDLEGVWALATRTGRPVIASGGIRGIEDLRALAALGGSVEGAVVGRALQDGDLDLAAAIAELG